MVERIGIIENMKADEEEELEMLLGEIPLATSLSLNHHHNHYHYLVNANPNYVNLNVNVNDQFPKPYISSRNPYLEVPESSFRNEIDENLIDKLGKMYIDHEQNEGLLSSVRFGDSGYFSRIRMNSDCETNQGFLGYRSNLDRSVLDYCYQYGIPSQNGSYWMNRRMQNVPYVTRLKAANANHSPFRFSHMAASGSSNIRTARELGCEDSLIIQGEPDLGLFKKTSAKPCRNGQTKMTLPSLHLMAKDQHGCRFLQKIFDDGNPKHVETVFNEIIEHVVELMINPFGNYLMQKLLEVCSEEQRMRILIAVTREPGELVQISLNTHGTRVVQKLIETMKTRQEVKVVFSALEPGFLSLIKDLNGNHVIQRCLQCLKNEDNKFIFEAASKFCVEIATHQHGCCVLQRCIHHSTGEHREKIVSEISKYALLLAQDAFGNYVVQYILELQIPSAVSKLTAQFEGNYVQLATQKFSSHVVEKCLALLDSETRSTIINELISSTHFHQLLQDPHANYVVQTALRVSEGPLHNALVNVIESHKAISQNSPFSKRIFSNKLLKK